MSNERLKEDVLYAFSVEPQHDQETLNRYVQRHPEFTEEFIELSLELRTNTVLENSESAVESDAKVKEAWREFTACVTAPVTGSNPFSRFRGEAFVELADMLGMPRSLLTALRDRIAEPSSVPMRTIKRLAESMSAPVEAMKDYLMQPPGMITTAQFKADKKPSQQGRVSFRQLIESTEMSDEQRSRILQDWDDDRPCRG